jgi:hypothetical protein
LKLRVSYTRDQDIQGRRDKPAVGIRFQQEFNSFDELLESLRKKKGKDTEGVSRNVKEEVKKESK